MKTSVVIPAYNEEDYIVPCLESMLSQKTPPDEIIVVDNNSRDRTAELAERMGAKVITEKEQGIVFARNAGFNAARHEIIVRCDADTRAPEDWIGKIKSRFETEDIVAISGPAYFYDLPERIHKEIPIQIFKKLHTLLYFRGTKVMLGHETLFGSNMALTKSAWEKVKNETCLDERHIHEDTDLSIHLAPHGRIMFDAELIVSISSRRAKSNLNDLISYVGRWPKTKLVHSPRKRRGTS